MPSLYHSCIVFMYKIPTSSHSWTKCKMCKSGHVCVWCFYFKLVDSCQASFVEGAVPTRDQRGRWSTSSNAPCCQASASCWHEIQHSGSLQTYCLCSWWLAASWKRGGGEMKGKVRGKDWEVIASPSYIESCIKNDFIFWLLWSLCLWQGLSKHLKALEFKLTSCCCPPHLQSLVCRRWWAWAERPPPLWALWTVPPERRTRIVTTGYVTKP